MNCAQKRIYAERVEKFLRLLQLPSRITARQLAIEPQRVYTRASSEWWRARKICSIRARRKVVPERIAPSRCLKGGTAEGGRGPRGTRVRPGNSLRHDAKNRQTERQTNAASEKL